MSFISFYKIAQDAKLKVRNKMQNYTYHSTEQNYQDEEVRIWFENGEEEEMYGVCFNSDGEVKLVDFEGYPANSSDEDRAILEYLKAQVTDEMKMA